MISVSGVELTCEELCLANAWGADLTGADLTGADLACADLARAYLAGAHLAGADLTEADLAGAHLARAHLAGADLAGADLAGAHLAGAHLLWAQEPAAQGDVVGWKKCRGGVVIELLIPKEARRSRATGAKHRAEFALALGDGVSCYDAAFSYRAGHWVIPDSWDDDWQNECGHGVHYFLSREQAEAFTM
jgi:hypothetical protein